MGRPTTWTHETTVGAMENRPHQFGESKGSQMLHTWNFGTSWKKGTAWLFRYKHHWYGQCSYMRCTNKRGDIHCAFIMGKSCVSSSKITTIPRLELTAAEVSVTMSSMLREEFVWTDSKVVLAYINNEARHFHTFVAKRRYAIVQMRISGFMSPPVKTLQTMYPEKQH